MGVGEETGIRFHFWSNICRIEKNFPVSQIYHTHKTNVNHLSQSRVLRGRPEVRNVDSKPNSFAAVFTHFRPSVAFPEVCGGTLFCKNRVPPHSLQKKPS